jgi:AhpD family alkylhydroperoxidase
MTLTKAEQELVAIGASVGAGCHPCTEYHLAEGAKAGLAQSEMMQALADAECVKRSAYNELAVRGRELLGEAAELPPSCCDDTSVAKEFVSVGSAVGANSIAQLRKHIDQARGVGIDLTQLAHAVKIAQNVQRHAAEATAKEAALLTQVVSRGHAPVFLTGSASAASSEEGCGAECGCHAEEAKSQADAGGCCGDEMAVPVVAGAKSAEKCC